MLQHGGDVYRNQNMIDFSANINPYGPPESVCKAMEDALKKVTCYPDPLCEALTKKIALSEDVLPEHIFCGNGAADVIFSFCQALRPKKAVVQAPTFSEYEQALRAAGSEIIYYETVRDQAFAVTRQIINCLTQDVDVLFLCNPNNPTGQLISPELLKEILQVCERYEIYLVIDECFFDFVEKEKAYSMRQFLGVYDRLMILKAFTKIYSIPGVRLGYGMMANCKFLEKMNRIRQPWSVSVLAQAAGEAALEEQIFVEESCRKIQREKETLYRALSECGFRVWNGEANYLFFEGPANLYENCKKQGILIRDCSNYVGLCKGDYRVAVKTKEENVKLIAACKHAMEER